MSELPEEDNTGADERTKDDAKPINWRDAAITEGWSGEEVQWELMNESFPIGHLQRAYQERLFFLNHFGEIDLKGWQSSERTNFESSTLAVLATIRHSVCRRPLADIVHIGNGWRAVRYRSPSRGLQLSDSLFAIDPDREQTDLFPCRRCEYFPENVEPESFDFKYLVVATSKLLASVIDRVLVA